MLAYFLCKAGTESALTVLLYKEVRIYSLLRSGHPRRHLAATRRCNTSLQHVLATCCCDMSPRVTWCILATNQSLRQNFVAAMCRTNSNWFEFVRHIAATKFCHSDCRSVCTCLRQIAVTNRCDKLLRQMIN